MLRRLPPFEAIEVFVAVADAGGLRAGAAAIALSPSAASRRVAALEAFLGTMLFERTDQGLRLSPAGQNYLNLVEPAVAAIKNASALCGDHASRITLATSHSLAARWLMPRMGALRSSEGIMLDVVPTRDPNVLRSGEAQLAIWGSLEAGDLDIERLLDLRARPVAAPGVIEDHGLARGEAALATCPLLATRNPGARWHHWFAAAGIEVGPLDITEFATLALMYEAAGAGVGVALGVPMLCEAQLQSGALVACGRVVPIGETYSLFRVRRRAGQSPTEMKFVRWLRREVAASITLFEDTATVAAYSPAWVAAPPQGRAIASPAGSVRPSARV